MEIKQLECFLKVAELLNFSRAAEALYISQPTLSYQIAELEQEIGVPLFERDRRNVYLTAAGQKLITPAKNLVEQTNNLPEIIRIHSAQDEGLLRISFDETEDHYEGTGITSTIANFSKAHPGVTLSMTCTSFQECLDQLTDGDCDVAFLILRNKETLPTDFASIPVYNSEIVMVINNDNPAETCEEAIANLDLLLVDRKPRGNSRILRTLEKMKLKPHIRHVDSLVAGFVYADMGAGIMLLSSTYYETHCYKQYKALTIPNEAAKITHVMVWKKGNDNPFIKKLSNFFSQINDY
ncbi:MAG: LysR family transcriptional regulator [Peptococcaceae bacterium]|nr:LysR family transcriptional regulator [Peptococcaceae bacterium]